MSPLAAVIIPAHNEAAVVGRCLQTILRNADPNEFEIIVVANGCTDHTSLIARRFPSVHVLEHEHASKSMALNLGDGHATAWPRIYVDADVRVSSDALRATAKAITDGALAAAPRLRIDIGKRPWMVRAYYQIYLQIPWTQDGTIGSGIYALSEEGHDRLGKFPELMADDLVVSRMFRPGERVTATGAHFTVEAPRTVWSLIRIKARVAAGNLEYRKTPMPSIEQSPQRRSSVEVYAKVIRRPSQWPAIVAHTTIFAITRTAARIHLWRAQPLTWTRDETIRSTT